MQQLLLHVFYARNFKIITRKQMIPATVYLATLVFWHSHFTVKKRSQKLLFTILSVINNIICG